MIKLNNSFSFFQQLEIPLMAAFNKSEFFYNDTYSNVLKLCTINGIIPQLSRI